MTRKILWSIVNGMLWIGYNIGEASEAVPCFSAKEDLSFSGGRSVKRKSTKHKKPHRSRSEEPKRPPRLPEVGDLPPPPPPPQEETREVVQVICNEHVLEAYRSSDCNSDELWRSMLILMGKTMRRNKRAGLEGRKNLVYCLAKTYKTADQDTKDAIALYFKIFHDDDDVTEQEATNFINECLVDDYPPEGEDEE
jgi:hypothetical protein